ncbi:hypothetical protein [Aquisalimonas sp.]|uniref:hypothetical protein n=1 Tax=Aquisalimonas sp. TaxID=1872621 RepID=UPI0025BA82C8|nr:hypothetical protein [Aquisalimonas sp.]
MTSWHVMNLGDAMMADDDLVDVKRRFDRLYRQRGRPPGMALYVRHVSEGRLHCDVIVYFSPGAKAVAEEIGADPCPPPNTEALGLLAGAG